MCNSCNIIMNIKRSSFVPVSNLKEKSNFKRYYRIERDGLVFERILLDVPDIRLREQLICLHYLKHYVKYFCEDIVGIKILSRDNPWDFKIELSTKEIFNIEITSIADKGSMFEKMKQEERYKSNSYTDKIPLHELIKLNKMFPNQERSNTIQEYIDLNLSKNEYVDNPFKSDGVTLFWSIDSDDKIPLEKLIYDSMKKKESKKHSQKDNTVLIIDNRTVVYEISDLNKATDTLSNFIDKCNFREIWFYTGYCSDLNGNNAEFSLFPLKLTENQKNILDKGANDIKPDESGIVYVNE